MNREHPRRPTTALVIGGLMLVMLACLCGPIQRAQELQSTIGAAQATIAPALTQYEQSRPTIEAQATQLMGTMNAAMPGFDQTMTAVMGQAGGSSGGGSGTFRQWASGASATSQLDDAHSAAQAAGDPGTEGCDLDKIQPNAWASAGENTVETLTLVYATPVVPTGISIHMVLNPGAVSKVDVLEVTGAEHTVYNSPPVELDFCPYFMQIDVRDIDTKVQTLIITVDQSAYGKRTQINAVELVGNP
jgi:hypothetical protein